jgi:uncharacterized membrane protein
MEDNTWRLLLFLSLGGLGLSAYLTAVSLVTTDLSYCAPYPFLSCEAVIYSPFSRIAGVPVALVGAVGFGLLFTLSYAALLGGVDLRRRVLLPTTLIAMAGLGFGVYLTYLELFVIRSLCILCLAAFLLILPVVVLGLWGLRGRLWGASRVEAGDGSSG